MDDPISLCRPSYIATYVLYAQKKTLQRVPRTIEKVQQNSLNIDTLPETNLAPENGGFQ